MAKVIDPDGKEIEVPTASFPTFGTWQYAPFRIFVEEGKRASQCVVCHGSIKKGEKRLKFLVKLPRSFEGANGKGRVYQEKRFAHPACLGIEKEVGVPTCHHCKESRAGGQYSHPLWTNKRHLMAYLCDTCAASPLYRKCSHCGYNFPRPMVSVEIERIVNGRAYNKIHATTKVVMLACKFCAADMDIETRQSWRKAQRDNERLELRFEELKRSLLGSVDSCQEDNQ